MTDLCLVVLTGTAVYLAVAFKKYIAALTVAEGFWLERRRQMDGDEKEYKERGFE